MSQDDTASKTTAPGCLVVLLLAALLFVWWFSDYGDPPRQRLPCNAILENPDLFDAFLAPGENRLERWREDCG